ncbi:MAG TPA: extracellular solute-binding protein [Acidimicrobiales bacterium]|nr:extracellular solute-binding protein [Acidimicrobiales bacterium]
MKRSKILTGLGVSAALVATMAPGAAVAQTKLTGKLHGVTLQFMIASSGPAETNADKAAAAAWGKHSGNKVQIINSSNLTEQLTQAFAGGTPPDVFYGETPMFESMAKQGQLLLSGNLVDKPSAFYPALVSAFTYNRQFYCVPKDSSTLALEINTDMWKAAGLTNADLPTTWAKLAADAKALTKGNVTGLVLSPSLDRIGAFFKEAGGSYMNAQHTKFTFDSPQNIRALSWLQSGLKQGWLKFSSQVNTGWGGEAFGTGKAAMTVEGNWIIGAMQSDYPSIHYEVVPMPMGPTGQHGTLVFTNCWGISASSKNTAAAVSFVKYLVSPAQQLRFANAFGVMPSRPSVAKKWATEHTTMIASGKQTPNVSAFVQGDAYAVPQVATVGFPTVQQNFESQLLALASGSVSPANLLKQIQTNAQALLQP